MNNDKNLWRREPRFDIFVDLLDPSLPYDYVYNQYIEMAKHRFNGMVYAPVKSDKISTDLRVAGNNKFKVNNWRSAMEYYNRSLLFAVTDSENLSLTYANRSACFFHMQKYNHCLKDIELAREHNYPKRLMQKLDEREIECVKYLDEKNGNSEDIEEPKLSFQADEMFPCMANVLEIKTNQRFGRHIVTKCDIDVGQTVLVEEGFITVFNANDRTLCRTCLKHIQNFIPCRGCTDTMFCDESCMERNDVHRIACGSALYRIPGNVQSHAESILVAIGIFKSVEHLMEFVENQLTSSKTELPRNCSSHAQMQYALFLKSDRMIHDTDPYQNVLKYVTYTLLMAIPSINEKFNTKKKQRFLLHLIWQHKNIMDRSSFTQTLADTRHELKDGENNISATCNINGLFNHSCIPNLFNDFVGNKQILITTRPVKKGEQLFVCYEQRLWSESPIERRKHLKRIYDFNCKCARCKPYAVDNSIESDPIYRCIEQSMGKTFTAAKRKMLKEKCYDFMRKYAHVACSNEIVLVTVQLMTLFQQDYPEYRRTIAYGD